MHLKLLTTTALALSLAVGAPAYAEGKGGDDFRKTAAEYNHKADLYSKKGMGDISAVYQRMAEIKKDAAMKADKGKWDDIDWSEYKQLEAKLASTYSKHKKTHK
jgi:pantoate kinase